MSLLDRISARSRGEVERRYSADQWISDYLMPTSFGFNGIQYGAGMGLSQTLAGNRATEITATLPGYLGALRGCPPAFAAQLVRALVLSQARFVFRNPPWHPATPRRTFGTRDLGLLERPWPNATTGELIGRMEWHAGLAGNAFVARQPDRLRVLRPDWVAILYGSQLEPEDPGHALDGKLIGYIYCNQGLFSQQYAPQTILPQDMAHWSPIPDPENAGVGMSWITPAIREIQKDRLATQHTIRYFEQGAPQPLDAKVLTPAGWSTMGAMRVGSQVIGSDGKPHDVVAVYPQGVRDIYRVTFSSGGQVECTEDHLWSVASIADRKAGLTRQMTLGQIMAGGVTYPSGPAKWSVPLVAPVEFDEPGGLPLDPYLLGSLLGDGYFCMSNSQGSGSVSLAAHTDDVDEQQRLLAPTVPVGVTARRRDQAGRSSELAFAREIGGPRTNALTGALRDLGLWGKRGYEKFIPAQYMRASVTARVALLQGLVDTDGSVERAQPNKVRFDNTSETLCRQLADLVGGLGGVASVRTARVGTETHRPQWRVTITRLPEWITPCRLARKAAIYRPTLRGGAYRYIQKVERVDRRPAQCISVDSSDHLYVTNDYVLTHNTPNLVVKGIPAATKEQFDEIVSMMEASHSGVANAYKTLYLTAGADATVVGSNLSEIDLKSVNGASETRIASLSRVHPVILGIAEGLAGSSLNAGNFGMARRIWADSWIYPTLQDLAASLAPLVKVPADAELWTDVGDMPILREDAKDAAEIMQTKMATAVSGVNGGFEWKSVIAAIESGDINQLKHTNLVSVQLQQPGVAPATVGGADPKALTRTSGESRGWNPAHHPRDNRGRFRRLGGGDLALAGGSADVKDLSGKKLYALFADLLDEDPPNARALKLVNDELEKREDAALRRTLARKNRIPADLRKVSDDRLYELWSANAADPEAVGRVRTELAGRRKQPDRKAPPLLDWADHGSDSNEQNRINKAIAAGADPRDAYADAYKLDSDIVRQQRFALVDLERRAGESRRDAVRRSYAEYTTLRYLDAENAVRGHLLTAEAERVGIDPVSLFSGPSARARKWASEDLKRWWAENPRVTYTEFAAQVLTGDRDAVSRIKAQGNAQDFGV